MLAKGNRVTAGTDYRRIVRTGRRHIGALTICSARFTSPSSPFRMGVIVTKKVGNAVVRNRVRRRVKAIGWQLAREIDGLDVVVRALPAAAGASWVTLEAEVRASVHELAIDGRARRPAPPTRPSSADRSSRPEGARS